MQQLVEEKANEQENATMEAARIRVTPQELAQATAAIKARQNALAQHEAATIPIGEAVQQLHLNATPEELLAEVEQQRRQRQAQRTVMTRQKRPVSAAVKILSAIIVLQVAVLALTIMRFNRMNQSLKQEINAQSAQILMDGQMLASSSHPNGTNGWTTPTESSLDPRQIKLLDSDKFRTLDLEEGQTVPCKFDVLEKMAAGPAPASVWTARSPKGVTWELTRHGNAFRVQCWTTPDNAQQLLNGGSGIVYANKEGAAGERPDMRIELPVTAFQNANVHITTDAPEAVVINGSH